MTVKQLSLSWYIGFFACFFCQIISYEATKPPVSATSVCLCLHSVILCAAYFSSLLAEGFSVIAVFRINGNVMWSVISHRSQSSVPITLLVFTDADVFLCVIQKCCLKFTAVDLWNVFGYFFLIKLFVIRSVILYCCVVCYHRCYLRVRDRQLNASLCLACQVLVSVSLEFLQSTLTAHTHTLPHTLTPY